MYTPHPAMKPKLREDLEKSLWISRPMPIHWEETKDERCARKKVLRSRSLHDMRTLSGWEAVTPYASLSVSDEHVLEAGGSSIRFTAPCKLDHWTGRIGRIYTVPKAFLHIGRENWEGWNRLTAWIYPDMPGYRNVCVRLQLHNDGAHKVPDSFDREGGHNLNLQNHTWNRVQFEIPYVARDEVVGVSLDYDMVGHEPCASGQACWYIGALYLEQVQGAEAYEGWETANGRIAYSHLGYQPGSQKTALCCGLCASRFQVVEDNTGLVAYEGEVQRRETTTGAFCVMDFTPLRKPGTYRLLAGQLSTQPFDISDTVWMDSIWKTINFIFCQRCGYRVPGKHEACHADQRTRHGEQEIVANGGWHDAADTNQQIQLTCEAVHALFELAMKVQSEDPLLYRRLLDEGIWGLSYLLKGRFGDGYRTGPSSSAVWTDGIRGTCDDLTFPAVNAPFVNLLAASAEAIGYRALKEEDRILAQYALQCAKEDFFFGAKRLDDPAFHPAVPEPGHDKMVSYCLMVSIAAFAAMELYEITGDPRFAQHGARYGDQIVSCQQRVWLPDVQPPVAGFFYRDAHHKTIIHYNHRSQEDKTTLALIALCRQLPEHPHWMKWHSALLYSMAYVKWSMRAVAPYGMLPSGIYSTDEIDDRETFSLMHPIFAMFAGKDQAGQQAETFLHYTDQLQAGIQLNERLYLRRFPVWYSFRGNFHVQLSLGKAVSAASIYLNDQGLYDIAQEQFMWILGKNPFSESLMFGVGYDYGTQYAVLHGDTVGALPVGMQSNEERDAPFWPQANNCTYKEIWMGPPGKWLAMMADEYLPAHITGDAMDVVKFEHAERSYEVLPKNGFVDAWLPAGRYTVTDECRQSHATLVAGGSYRLDQLFNGFEISAQRDGNHVILTISGEGQAQLRTDNLTLDALNVTLRGDRVLLEADLICQGAPWSAALLPNEDPTLVLSVQG